MKDKAIYTTKEAADYLGVSSSTIYRMEKRGLLFPARTPGRQRRFTQENLEEYLRKSRNLETSLIREKRSLYKVNAEIKPYFQEDSIRIYNADFIRTGDSVRIRGRN